MKNHRCNIALVVMMYLIMAATLPSAQSDTSSPSGTISDSSGIVVPNAGVTVRNKAAQTIRDAPSRKMAISLSLISPPGTYSVRVDRFSDHVAQ